MRGYFFGRKSAPVLCRFAAVLTVALLFARTVWAANIGTVVPVVGQVSDLVHDGSRNLVYLANPVRNQVEIYSVEGRRLVGTIQAGSQPQSLAISPDGNTLYVANIGSNTISAINLSTQRLVSDFGLSSRPDSIVVGSDGNVVILGTTGLLRLEPGTGRVTPVSISPPPTPPAGIQPPPNSPPLVNFFAGLVSTASGNLIIGLAGQGAQGVGANRLFVYEVASGTVIRSRTVTGLRAILSAAPDGSRFMAGPFLFDTQTLTILGRAGTVVANLTGGSAFSADGNAVYATFSTQNPINPLNSNNPQNPGGAVIPGGITGLPNAQQTQAVLQVLRSSSLAQEMGLRLAEPITSKIIASVDGQNLFANSTSGLLVIPVGQLSSLPILDVSATNVVLSADACNRTTATATVQIRNIGGGRLTFAATTNNLAAPLVLSVRSGVAPATMNISFDARNITARGTLQFVVILVSPEAVNIEPAILVNLNLREVSDRGTIVPMSGVGVDMQMDTARQRLYIANYSRDQIEVFSLPSQTFLPPIRVGNRPRSMAIVNSNTMVVANSGAENLSIVDLDALQEIDQISMGPLPLNAQALFPRAVAASSNAILFSAAPLPAIAGLPPGNGSIWQLSLLTRRAFPRLNLGTGTLNVVQGRNMLASPADGSGILLVEGNGSIRLYDSTADTFLTPRLGAVPQLRGTVSASADGSFYVVDNTVFNSSLTSQGSLAPGGGPIVTPPIPGPFPPGQQQTLAFGVAISGNNAIRVQAVTPQSPVQTLQRFNLTTLQSNLQVSLPEQVMDLPIPAQTQANTRQWPPRAIVTELTQTNQAQLLPRGMVVDNNNNAYLLTFSGLSIVSLTAASGQAPAIGNIVNSPSRSGAVSPGALISILGSNLAEVAAATATPLPTSLGGVCVTVNEVSIPLLATSPTQIDAQLPSNLAAGRVVLTVRSTRLGQVSTGFNLQVNTAGPSIFSMNVDGQQRAALFHSADFMLVIPAYPGLRDEYLDLYVTGLGPTSPPVPAGQLTPADPVSLPTQTVSVTIGGRAYPVASAVLAPGYVGVYRVTIYVPGDTVRGDNLPVVVTAGGASSGTNNAPLAAIQ